jgi:hypothetical protein
MSVMRIAGEIIQLAPKMINVTPQVAEEPKPRKPRVKKSDAQDTAV